MEFLSYPRNTAGVDTPMKIPGASVLGIITVVFFIVISLPLNYALSSAIGVENATLVLSIIYMILTGITFFVIFRKYFA